MEVICRPLAVHCEKEAQNVNALDWKLIRQSEEDGDPSPSERGKGPESGTEQGPQRGTASPHRQVGALLRDLG